MCRKMCVSVSICVLCSGKIWKSIEICIKIVYVQQTLADTRRKISSCVMRLRKGTNSYPGHISPRSQI